LNAWLISFDRIEALCWFGERWRSQEPERSFAVSFLRHKFELYSFALFLETNFFSIRGSCMKYREAELFESKKLMGVLLQNNKK
jgi:hypothetical protein